MSFCDVLPSRNLGDLSDFRHYRLSFSWLGCVTVAVKSSFYASLSRSISALPDWQSHLPLSRRISEVFDIIRSGVMQH